MPLNIISTIEKKKSHKKIINKYLGDPENAKQNLFKILND